MLRLRGGAALGQRARWALALVMWASALTGAAAAAPAPLSTPLHTEQIGPGLYRINGAGGGTLLRLGAAGAVVVDSKRAGAYRPLMAEIQRIAKAPDVPIRALVLTAAVPDQAGNAAQFAAAGVPVIAHRQALARLSAYAAAAGTALPAPPISYDTDYLQQQGDVHVEVEHVGRGRTGVDSIAFFRDLRVLAVGELYTHDTPVPDCASGGSFAGWAAAVAHLMWFDFDIAVPSRGAPVDKRELAAFRARLLALAGPADSPQPQLADCGMPK
jgi:glyoxylase-like metal-dependent hydrolase (beta-lactamase superfamily II)